MSTDKSKPREQCTEGRYKKDIEGERKMAVSKAVLTCVKGKGARELIEDIKQTSLNTEVISDCQALVKKLMEATNKK